MSNIELVKELRSRITAFSVTSRKMFGGIGVFSDKVMFALVYDGVLYFKSTPEMAKTYTENTIQFEPPFRRPIKMPYWSVPENILEDKKLLIEWAGNALEHAKVTKKQK
jgi:DNA transformation protein